MPNSTPHRSRKRQLLDALHLLISHHEPPFMNRCWRISFRGHTLHICTRCSALFVGIPLGLFIQFNIFRIEITPLTFLGAFLLSLPAVVDWSTQTLGLRESRSSMRAFTGFLLGYAVGFVLSSLNLFYVLLVAVLYSGYILGFGALAIFITRRSYHRRHRNSPEDSIEIPSLLPPVLPAIEDEGEEE